MADVFINDVCLWISHVGCGFTRRVLLALEPGARIWLLIDERPMLFERMQDGPNGRSTRGLKPVGPSKDDWYRRYQEERNAMADLAFVERPLDLGAAADRG